MPPNVKYPPFFEWQFCLEQRFIYVPYLHVVGSISSVNSTCLTGAPVQEKGTESEWGDWRMPRPNVIWCKSGSGEPFAAGGHTSNHPPLCQRCLKLAWEGEVKMRRRKRGREGEWRKLYRGAMRHQQTAESTAFLEQTLKTRQPEKMCDVHDTEMFILYNIHIKNTVIIKSNNCKVLF